VITLIIFLVLACFVFLNKNSQKTGENSVGANLLNSGKTAQSAYQTTLTEAIKKRDDARPVDISAYVNNKGTSDNWYVEFYSASSGELFKISIKNGKVTDIIDQKTTKKESIGENWVDSNRAVERALQECGQVTEKTYFVSLDHLGANIKWNINCKVGENKTLRVEIDAPTGVYIATHKAGIGW